jgi:hypothetical protein
LRERPSVRFRGWTRNAGSYATIELSRADNQTDATIRQGDWAKAAFCPGGCIFVVRKTLSQDETRNRQNQPGCDDDQQPWPADALKHLRDLIGTAHVYCVPRGTDRYGRTVAACGTCPLGRSLEAEIKRLHDQEVNAGFELLASSKELWVWIGDELNGVEKLAIVSPAEAADWLHRTAREMVR